MPLQYTDMTGHIVHLSAPPRRIVSTVPSQTELLFDLGLENEVVGITKFCVHPEQWFRTKTRIGGTKNLNLRKLADLKPDLVIANKEENTKEQIEAIRNFCPVWTSDIADLHGAISMIQSVGILTAKESKSTEIISGIREGFQNLPATIPAKVLYLIWHNPWMSVGGDTFIHDMIRAAGWENVMSGFERYPVLNDDMITKCGADLVLLSSEPFPFRDKHAAAIACLLAEAQIRFVDGEMFSWYGSRLLLAPSYFRELRKNLSNPLR